MSVWCCRMRAVVRRWRKRFLTALAAVVATLGLTYGALRIESRLNRGPLVAGAEDARWIAASAKEVVIGIAGADEHSHRILSVDPTTLRTTELFAGDGRLQANAADHEFAYWSISASSSLAGTYAKPLGGGPSRRVSDRVAVSLGVGAGHACFVFATKDEEEIWFGPAGGGPERRVKRPTKKISVADLAGGFAPPKLRVARIALDESQAIWIAHGDDVTQNSLWSIRMERAQYARSDIEEVPLPCPFPSEIALSAEGLSVVCSGDHEVTVLTIPKHGGPAKTHHVFTNAEALTVDGHWLYLDASWHGEQGNEENILRFPLAGGAAHGLVRFGRAPFALAGARLFYSHFDGVASVPVSE